MKEGDIIKARAAAEIAIEPLFRIIKQTLIETYMKGFMKGVESTEDVGIAMKRLIEEADAFESGAEPIDEPKVRLKPDAILKRKLRREDFNRRVWNTLMDLNITTLGELLQVSEKFYRQQRNFGEGSLNVIKNFVKQFGYELKK